MVVGKLGLLRGGAGERTFMNQGWNVKGATRDMYYLLVGRGCHEGTTAAGGETAVRCEKEGPA